jgi:hypothetical protein
MSSHQLVSLIVRKSVPAEKRMAYAEVYAPNRPDSDGEFMSEATIEKMAHDFVKKGRLKQVDVQHDNKVIKGVEIVETFIARKGDPDFIPGSWVVGIHIDHAETWEKVKKGELNGLSVEALVGREERDVELHLPPVISGRTTKSEEHDHQFFVNYSPEGDFLGGVTDTVKGHQHAIKGGTVTEECSGHRHRFSSVDSLEIVG